VIYALNPENYAKYTNYIMKNNFKKRMFENHLNQKFKHLNNKHLLTKKKTLIFRKIK